MRIIIIGGVAAGTTAATNARRNDSNAEIVIYEKDDYISYAGCGIPYYLGGIVDKIETLAPRGTDFFMIKHNIDVIIRHEVVDVDTKNKTVQVKNLNDGKVFTDKYDKLVFATGATAVIPPIKGMENKNVFTLRNINDMKSIKSFIDTNKPSKAAIIGTGFIGLELCENFKRIGIEVTMIERLEQVTPGLDKDMADYVEKHLVENGIKVLTGVSAAEFKDDRVILENGKEEEADFFIVSTGVRPNTVLAVKAGIELGVTKAIKINELMQTSVQDIYACGDCCEQTDLITNKPIYRPLGTNANKMGTIAGENISGGSLKLKGVLGTGIFKVFGMSVGLTGMSEAAAEREGFDVVVSHDKKSNKPEYMGGKEMIIKGVADAKSGRILGAQIIGFEGVDKRLDVLVTAITYNAKAEDLFYLDLAYAPPFSIVRDPIAYTGMMLNNKIIGKK